MTETRTKSGSLFKSLIKAMLRFVGLEVSVAERSPLATKYFGTGDLTPFEENSRELYDQFYSDEEVLDDYYQECRLDFYTAVIEKLNGSVDLDQKNILDNGCGVGFLLAEVSKKYNPSSLSGADFSEEAMKASRKRFPSMNFFQHDANDPLTDKYDVIFCTEVIEHLEKPFIAVQNMLGALNPGGALVLSVPDGRTDTSNEHINFWSPESWKMFLERECPNYAVKTSRLSDKMNYLYATITL